MIEREVGKESTSKQPEMKLEKDRESILKAMSAYLSDSKKNNASDF